MSTATSRLNIESLTPVHWIGIVMALISALVHLVLGVEFFPHWMGVLFLLSTGGFLGAIVLVLLDFRRWLVYLLGIPFTASQIVGWYVVNQPANLGSISGAELADKIAQVVLVVVLVILLVRES